MPARAPTTRARARALDAHVEVLDALLLSGTARRLGGHLGRERRRSCASP